MYSSRPTYSSPPPELSNNPFIDHASNALARYPDISGSGDLSGSSQYTSWVGGGQPNQPLNANPTAYYSQAPTSPTGYGGVYQPQPPQLTGWGAGGSGFAQPQQPPYGQLAPTSPGGPFQPSSSFGQQLVGQVNGAPYGGMPPQQQQQQQQQYSGYPASPQYAQGYQQGYAGQQQQPAQSQYLAEFDPYAQTQSAQAGAPGTGAGAGAGANPAGQYSRPHPRDFVRIHKAELETWDSYTWKQAQISFEALRSAWEGRKAEIEGRMRALGGAGLFGGGQAAGYGPGMYGGGGGGGPAQQYAQLERMAKEADMFADTVAAGAFQMQEVYTGYRQSSDIASRRRVREAINAALSSLPDWPQPL